MNDHKWAGRTSFAKRVKKKEAELFAEYPADHKTESLCKRIAYLETSIEDQEVENQGKPDGGLVQAVNTLQGLYRQIDPNQRG